MIDFDFCCRSKRRESISEIMQIRDLMGMEIGVCRAPMMMLVVPAIEMGNAYDALKLMQAVKHPYALLIHITKCVCKRGRNGTAGNDKGIIPGNLAVLGQELMARLGKPGIGTIYDKGMIAVLLPYATGHIGFLLAHVVSLSGVCK